ncbi:MAG: flagellinolysin [Butyrivibrio sp.]|nr:flagellinolysin [Butyrivibrio sp.]
MIIRHNLQAMGNQRQLGITASHRAQTQEKLSSGYAVNRAADNAAGLSISEKMRRQIRGLNRASLNAQDGISFAQIADGALTEVHDMLQRGNELSVQAANGTNSESDRQAINAEIEQLKEEIDAISSRTKFNELEVFPRTGEWPRLTGVNPNRATRQAVEALAKKISDEYVPNAVAQILDNIGSLGTAMRDLAETRGQEKYDMALDISYIDGVSGTLAYVQASFALPAQEFADGSLLLKVDKDDFPSLNLSDSDEQMLESTIAHEMMHGIMDALFPARMYSNDEAKDFPKWFKEGTAQLTGGGFTTGWNDTLHALVGGLSGAGDTRKDEDIAKYLKSDTVDNRVYGHGYLAAAYACHLAGGGGDEVTKEKLLAGADKIFQAFLDDPNASFDDVMAGVTGVSVADLKDAINDATDEGVDFVRRLSYASKGGAGSLITEALNTGGRNILGNTAKKEDQPIRINDTSLGFFEVPDDSYKGSATIKLHIGADAENSMELKRFGISAKALELTDTSVLSADQATAAINDFGYAIKLVSFVRSYYGAVQNRLEHTIRNLDNVAENTTAAESRIRDADIPKELVNYARSNILMQAGQSLLAQANHSADGVMSLL